jgi:hypothetical protein
MANNPLYPGYSPGKKGEESINPLYPGYYTGKPIPKKKDPKNYVKPIEFNIDTIMKEIDHAAEIAMLDPSLGPKWLVERVVDDWKQQLKASILPEGMTPTDLDDYANQDYVQASISLSINPEDWGLSAKGIDPEKTGKQAFSTVGSWVKQATGIDITDIRKSDFSKLENEINRRVTLHALGYGEELEKLTGQEKQTEEYFTKKVLIGEEEKEIGDKPLNLKGVEVTNEKGEIVIKDLYSDAAKSASDFMSNRDNAKLRDSSHSKFVQESLGAIDKELKSKIFGTDSSNVESIKNKYQDAFDFYDSKVKTAEEINRLQKNLADASKKIKKTASGVKFEAGYKEEDGTLEKLETTDPSKALQHLINTDSFYKEGDLEKQNLLEQVNKVKINSEERLKKAEELLKNKKISQKNYDDFASSIKELQSHLESIDSTLRGVVDKRITVKDALKVMDGKGLGTNLANRSTFSESIAGKLQKSAEFSLLSNEEGNLGSLFSDTDAKSLGIDIRAGNLVPLMKSLREDRISYATEEILSALDGGKFGERYLWKKMNQVLPERVTRWTTGQVLGDYLEKKNYFGLVIDDEKNAAWLESLDPKMRAAFEKKWARKLEMEVDPNLFGTDKIVIKGGDQFKILNNKIIGNSFNERVKLENKRFDLIGSVEDKNLMTHLLVGDDSIEIKNKIAQKLFGKNWSQLGNNDKREAQKFINEFKSLGTWMEKIPGGKIKSTSISLDESVFGISSVGLPFASNHLNVFLDKKMDLFNLNDSEHKKMVIMMLSGRTVSMNKLVKLLGQGDFNAMSAEEQQKWLQFVEDFKTFGKWLRDQDDRFGDLLRDNEILYKLFSAFKEGDIRNKLTQATQTGALKFKLFTRLFKKNENLDERYKLTKKFMGRLEKINEKVNVLLKKFQKSKLGKVFKSFSTWRNKLAQRGAAATRKLLTKLLTKLLGATAVATGLGALLLPVIERLASYAIKKILGYGEATLKAFVKWDFDDLRKMFNKDMQKALKLFVIFMILPWMAIFLPALAIYTVFSSSTSPVDRTRSPITSFGELAYNFTEIGYDGEIPGNCDPTSFEGGPDWYLAQCDEDWYNIPIDASKWNVGNAGCLMTSLAMVYQYHGYPKVTPAAIADIEEYFTTEGNMMYADTEDWDPKLYEAGYIDVPDSGIIYENTTYSTLPSSNINTWKNWFENHNGVMIIGINNSVGTAQHWVVISGYDPDTNDFILMDPWSGPNKRFLETYSDFIIIGARGYYKP